MAENRARRYGANSSSNHGLRRSQTVLRRGGWGSGSLCRRTCATLRQSVIEYLEVSLQRPTLSVGAHQQRVSYTIGRSARSGHRQSAEQRRGGG